MSIKLETDAIRTIALFESMTKVHAKDCLITDSCIYFLVEQSKIGLAIGKSGMVIKNVKRALNKNVKIFSSVSLNPTYHQGFATNRTVAISNSEDHRRNLQ